MICPCMSPASAGSLLIFFHAPLIYRSICVLSSVLSFLFPLLLSFTLIFKHSSWAISPMLLCLSYYLHTCDDFQIFLFNFYLYHVLQALTSVSWLQMLECLEKSQTQHVLKWTQHLLFNPVPSWFPILGVVLTTLLLNHARIWKPSLDFPPSLTSIRYQVMAVPIPICFSTSPSP